jgi:hypothetical protein
MALFGSSFFTGIGKFVANITTLQGQAQALKGSMVYSFKVTTGTDGTAVLDYTTLGLTVAPRIVVLNRLALATDIPVFVNLVGDPTATKATIQARRISSILSLGLVPQYSAVASMTLDVLVRPVVS